MPGTLFAVTLQKRGLLVWRDVDREDPAELGSKAFRRVVSALTREARTWGIEDCEEMAWKKAYEAFVSFDPMRGVPFISYAFRLLKREMQDEYRAKIARSNSPPGGLVAIPDLEAGSSEKLRDKGLTPEERLCAASQQARAEQNLRTVIAMMTSRLTIAQQSLLPLFLEHHRVGTPTKELIRRHNLKITDGYLRNQFSAILKLCREAARELPPDAL